MEINKCSQQLNSLAFKGNGNPQKDFNYDNPLDDGNLDVVLIKMNESKNPKSKKALSTLAIIAAGGLCAYNAAKIGKWIVSMAQKGQWTTKTSDIITKMQTKLTQNNPTKVKSMVNNVLEQGQKILKSGKIGDVITKATTISAGIAGSCIANKSAKENDDIQPNLINISTGLRAGLSALEASGITPAEIAVIE